MALEILLAGGEIGLPAYNRLEGSGRVVVVGVRLFAENAAEIRGQCDLLVGRLGVLLVLDCRGLDDLLLLVHDLQAVGLGIAAVVHQVGDGEHCPDENFFVILAGVGQARVVGEHARGLFGRAILLEVIEAVADLSQQALRFRRAAIRQQHQRLLELDDVVTPLALGDRFVEGAAGHFEPAAVEVLASQLECCAWVEQPASAARRRTMMDRRASMERSSDSYFDSHRPARDL
jgi:hypothetical protein